METNERSPGPGTGRIPDRAEILRRSNFVANRGREMAGGKVECPICGKSKRRLALASHIRRQHRAELLVDFGNATLQT